MGYYFPFEAAYKCPSRAIVTKATPQRTGCTPDIIQAMKRAGNVDEYIANSPKEIQEKLRELRKIIKTAAPKALEKISYGMPYYGYNGRLAYFAGYKNHIGLYLTPPITQMFKKELKDYETHMATIRFPHDKKLPVTLIKKLIKARIKLNEGGR